MNFYQQIIDLITKYIDEYCPEIISCVFRLKLNETAKVQEKINQVIDCVFKKHGPTYLMNISSSSGLVLVLVFKKYVVKIACKASYVKMKLAFEKLDDSPFLCKMFEANDEYQYTVEEVVKPIINDMKFDPEYKNMTGKLYKHIKQAIDVFEKNNLCHADCRLDNVGYRKFDKTFILFDFNSVRKITYDNQNNDMNTLLSSIEYYT